MPVGNPKVGRPYSALAPEPRLERDIPLKDVNRIVPTPDRVSPLDVRGDSRGARPALPNP